MATRRSKKKRLDRYDIRDPAKYPPHADQYWEMFLEEFQRPIERVLDSEAKRPDRSPDNAVSEIFSILDAYTLYGTMTSPEAPTVSPMLDLGGQMAECRTALDHPAPPNPYELCLQFFALGWRAQVAFKARAWWKLKEQTQSASARGAKAAASQAAERNELMKGLAVPIAIRYPKWSNERIARKIIKDAKRLGPDMAWLAARGIDRVKRVIGPAVREARKRFLGPKRPVRSDRGKAE